MMDESALAAHRALYDAVEAGDADLMTALWVDDPGTSCVHPGAPILRGTPAVVRSWVVLMAQIGYIQFFLTDVEVTMVPLGGADQPETAVVTCTENILSGDPNQSGGIAAATSFGAATAHSTSILVRDGSAGSGGGWKFWLRHASAVVPTYAGGPPDEIEEV